MKAVYCRGTKRSRVEKSGLSRWAHNPVGASLRRFESCPCHSRVEQLAACQAHNLEVGGPNPPSAKVLVQSQPTMGKTGEVDSLLGISVDDAMS